MTVLPQELARTLVSRHRSKRQLLAARAERLRVEVAAAMAAFLGSRPAARAWLVGSLARGELGERSDVDVAVSGVSPQDAAELSLALASRLEVAVDVLRLEELLPAARGRVEAEGVPLDVP
jgi:predicted nucleotidyltransferase